MALLVLPVQAETQPPAKVEVAAKADAKAADPPVPFVCPALGPPVIRLDHGSRYNAKDKSHSNFDNASNAEVNAQLKPVDDFVSDMVGAANTALSATEPKATACVVDGLTAWASAGALGDMGSVNAGLSVPSRVAGLAYAWAEVKPLVQDGAQSDAIESWLAGLAHASMDFFDSEAPGHSARNNLRAWAGLAVARVGLTLKDEAMIDWADASVKLVACSAAPDGSLPLEMARKELALHYQLHALTALVTTAVLLQQEGHTLFQACDGSLHRSIRFAVEAFADPTLVTKLAGAKQSYFDGSDKLQGFELAWAAGYLATFYDPELAAFVKPFKPLANSKLGGLQSLLWPGTP
jgi:poly(beta-D-mannuronate) lyase